MAVAIALRRHRATHFLLRAARRKLTSVRVALLSVLVLGVVTAAGVVLPQMPAGLEGRADLTTAWLEAQEVRFGILTEPLYRSQLFDIFHSWWYIALLGWLALSISVCTWSRLPALWRQAFRPSHRVADALFERPSSRVAWNDVDAARLQRSLRRRWFRVWRYDEAGATYLFADRFPWAVLGTLATHVALILFLVGALVSKFDSYSSTIAIAEGSSAPALPFAHPDQIMVEVERAVGLFNEAGRPLDYRSDLVLSRGGETVRRCTITVNEPCELDGYRFHQSGFFGYGAELVVRSAATGAVLYHETLALSQSMAAPTISIADESGRRLYAGSVPQTDRVGDALGALISPPGVDTLFWVGLRGGDPDWTLVVFDPTGGADGDRAFIAIGESASVGATQFEFEGVSGIPSLMTAGILVPGSTEATLERGDVLLVMENAVYGNGAAPAGAEPEGDPERPPRLHLMGIAPVAVKLAPAGRVVIGAYEYEFVGPRNFAGIAVRRDRGDTLIWIASGLFVLGLTVTLWLPRRRAWFRIANGDLWIFSSGRTQVDGEDLAQQLREGPSS